MVQKLADTRDDLSWDPHSHTLSFSVGISETQQLSVVLEIFTRRKKALLLIRSCNGTQSLPDPGNLTTTRMYLKENKPMDTSIPEFLAEAATGVSLISLSSPAALWQKKSTVIF